MHNIDIFNNSKVILERSIPDKIISWLTILKILLIIVIIFSFIPFNTYKSYIGYINKIEGKTYITLIYNNNDFPFNKNDELYINYDKYKYEVLSIEDNTILVKIDDSINIENNIVKLYFLKKKTTIFKIVKEKLKKGLM